MVSRRSVLRIGLGAAGGVLVPGLAAAAEPSGPRRLKLRNTHTDELLDAVYYESGRYVPDALAAVNRLLRDHRSGAVHSIDLGLVDTLSAVARQTGSAEPFEIISGYRSPVSNAAMRKASRGVARRSLHMDGQAVDIRQRRVDLPRLRAAARSLERGGVGYYPQSQFVHVDVGPVRTWQGV